MKKVLAILLSLAMVAVILPSFGGRGFTASADVVNAYSDIVQIYNLTGTVSNDARILSCSENDTSITLKVTLGADDYIQFTKPANLINKGSLDINLEDHDFGTAPGTGNSVLESAYYNCDMRIEFTGDPDYTNSNVDARWVITAPGLGYTDVDGSNPYIIASAGSRAGGPNAWRFIARRNNLLARGVALSLVFNRDEATDKIRIDSQYSDKNTGEDADTLYTANYTPADDEDIYLRIRSNRTQTYNIRLNTFRMSDMFNIYNTTGSLTSSAAVLDYSWVDGSFTAKVQLGYKDYVQFADSIPDIIDNPNVIEINLEDHEFGTTHTQASNPDLFDAYHDLGMYLQLTENSDYTAVWSHSAGPSWPLYGNGNARIASSTRVGSAVIQTNKNDGWGSSNMYKYFTTVSKMMNRAVAIPLVFHKSGSNIYLESAVDSDGSDLSDGTTTDSYADTGKPLYVRFLEYTTPSRPQVYNIRINSAAYDLGPVRLYNMTGRLTSGAEVISCTHEDGHLDVKVRLGYKDYIQFNTPVSDLLDNPSALQINLEDHEFGTTHTQDSNPTLYDAYHNCYFYVQATENPDLTANYSNGGGSSWGASWPLCGNAHSRVSGSTSLNIPVVHSNKNDGWGGASFWAFFGKVDDFVARSVAMNFIFHTDSDNKIYFESPLEDSSSGASWFKDNFTPTGAPLYLRVMDYEGTGLSQVFNIRLYSKDLEYESADYSKVEAAKARWAAIKYKGVFTDASRSAVESAINSVVMGLRVNDQDRVDGFADAINSAIDSVAVDNSAFKAASITITSDLRLNFYVPKALVDALGGNPAVTFRTMSVVGEYFMDGVRSEYPVTAQNGKEYYVYSYEKIGPDRVGEEVTAMLSGTYNGGTAYASTNFIYSVKDYCMDELGRTSDSAERTLLVDLLNYGAESQTYADYGASNLVNKDLNETQRGYATPGDPELTADRRALGDGSYTAAWTGVSLNLKDTVGIKYTLDPKGVDVTSVKITDTAGKTLATINADAFADGSDGKKVILFSGLTVTEMSKVVKATAYNGDTQVSKSLSYSIDSYAYLKKDSTYKNLAALVKTMIKYGNAAVAYKASQSITTPPVLYDTYNMEQDLTPITSGNIVYSESILFFPDPMTGEVNDAPLLYEPVEVIAVRSSDLLTTYTEGVDYEVVNGCIRRLPGSRIAVIDYDKLYPTSVEGDWVAEHRRLDGRYCYITENYFPTKQVVVTYTHNGTWEGPVTEFAGDTLPITVSKLKSNEDVKIVIYGDSISYGASASRTIAPFTPSFFNMFIQKLTDYYQNDHIEAVNNSKPGMGSEWGKKNAEERVTAEEADLCIIGWGMNGSTDEARARYEQDIRSMISAARRGNPQAEIILISSHRANPDAVGYGENIKDYQVMLHSIADDTPGVAVLDMTEVHEYLLTRKRFLDMEANGVNHPSDFLARVHAQNLAALLIPSSAN